MLAGRTPLVGAQVQLYAAGTGGNGSLATALLPAPLLTDTDGTFALPAGAYTCPSPSSILYLVSTGGRIENQAANPATVFLTVPGACSGIAGGATYVLDEVTTVATAFVLRPFLQTGSPSGPQPGPPLGASATNTGGLNLGVASLGNLVDLTTGLAPGPGLPSNATAPLAKLNTLANLLNGCAAAQAGVSSPACTNLFAQATGTAATPPTDTADAALAIAGQPAANVSALFGLAAKSSAFTPALKTAPPDWTLAMAYTGGGMNAPTAVAVDSAGKVWVANYFGVVSLFSNTGAPLFPGGITGYGLGESYGGAVDPADRMWIANQENADVSINGGIGSLTVLNSNGPALPGSSVLSSGGLDYPSSVAFDRNGTAWVVDYGDAHITVLNSAGVPQSGSGGYTSAQFAFPIAVAVDSGGNGWVANQSAGSVTRVAPDGSAFTSFTVGNGPSAVAVDAGDNIWTANYFGDSLGLISSAGQVLSSGGFVGGGLNHPTGIAVDGAGTAWVANYRAPGISAFAGISATNPSANFGSALSPAAGFGPDQQLLEAFDVAVDAGGNVWFSSTGDSRLVEFLGAATPVKTPLLGGVRVP